MLTLAPIKRFIKFLAFPGVVQLHFDRLRDFIGHRHRGKEEKNKQIKLARTERKAF